VLFRSQDKASVIIAPRQGLAAKTKVPNMQLYKAMWSGNLASGLVSFRNYSGKQLLYFTALQTMHCGLQEVRYSLNSMALDKRLKLAKCNPQQPFSMPSDLPLDYIYSSFALDTVKTVAVQVVWKDKYETESDTVVYEPCKDVGEGTCAWRLE